MTSMLVTGGTTFVSRYVARYFVAAGYEVYVLNRNSKPQVPGVRLIEADRHRLGDALRGRRFDVVADVTAYDAADIVDLLGALGPFGRYVMVSSSAVYPEHAPQPFREDAPVGPNRFWGGYGTGKIEAERALLDRVRDAYVLRPPYLYGPMNNVYREAFVFDCAKAGRRFYLPGDGGMGLQFLHVADLCGIMAAIIADGPAERVWNVGNPQSVSVRDWVAACYACYGRTPEFVQVGADVERWKYFCFRDYEYRLDVERQRRIYSRTVPLGEGLREAAAWYDAHGSEVDRRPYLRYIDENLS